MPEIWETFVPGFEAAVKLRMKELLVEETLLVNGRDVDWEKVERAVHRTIAVLNRGGHIEGSTRDKVRDEGAPAESEVCVPHHEIWCPTTSRERGPGECVRNESELESSSDTLSIRHDHPDGCLVGDVNTGGSCIGVRGAAQSIEVKLVKQQTGENENQITENGIRDDDRTEVEQLPTNGEFSVKWNLLPNDGPIVCHSVVQSRESTVAGTSIRSVTEFSVSHDGDDEISWEQRPTTELSQVLARTTRRTYHEEEGDISVDLDYRYGEKACRLRSGHGLDAEKVSGLRLVKLSTTKINCPSSPFRCCRARFAKGRVRSGGFSTGKRAKKKWQWKRVAIFKGPERGMIAQVGYDKQVLNWRLERKKRLSGGQSLREDETTLQELRANVEEDQVDGQSPPRNCVEHFDPVRMTDLWGPNEVGELDKLTECVRSKRAKGMQSDLNLMMLSCHEEEHIVTDGEERTVKMGFAGGEKQLNLMKIAEEQSRAGGDEYDCGTEKWRGMDWPGIAPAEDRGGGTASSQGPDEEEVSYSRVVVCPSTKNNNPPLCFRCCCRCATASQLDGCGHLMAGFGSSHRSMSNLDHWTSLMSEEGREEWSCGEGRAQIIADEEWANVADQPGRIMIRMNAEEDHERRDTQIAGSCRRERGGKEWRPGLDPDRLSHLASNLVAVRGTAEQRGGDHWMLKGVAVE